MYALTALGIAGNVAQFIQFRFQGGLENHMGCQEDHRYGRKAGSVPDHHLLALLPHSEVRPLPRPCPRDLGQTEDEDLVTRTLKHSADALEESSDATVFLLNILNTFYSDEINTDNPNGLLFC